MKEIIQRVKGTRDFYPEDMAFRTWLHQQSKLFLSVLVIRSDAPFLEKLDLMLRSPVKNCVKNRRLFYGSRRFRNFLRPELTPSWREWLHRSKTN